MQSGKLDVGGAHLYYEKRGHGPALLLISGAGGDAGYFSNLADELADTFLVITYDRRGNSRSTPPSDRAMVMSEQSADAAALIRSVAGERALVFGNSGGGIVSLDLAARHPDLLLGVIAHEPPIVKLLPRNDPDYDCFERLGARYAKAGALAAAQEFVATVRGEGSYTWPPDVMSRFAGNVEHLFQWEWQTFGNFLPDLTALRQAPFPIVLGAGSSDRGLYYARPSIQLATQLRAPWVEFPGIHLEFMPRPAPFAAALRAVATQIYTRANGVPELWKNG